MVVPVAAGPVPMTVSSVAVMPVIVFRLEHRLGETDQQQQHYRAPVQGGCVVEQVVRVDGIQPAGDQRRCRREDEPGGRQQPKGGGRRAFPDHVHRRRRQNRLVAVKEQPQRPQKYSHHQHVAGTVDQGSHQKGHDSQDGHPGNEHELASEPVGKIPHHRAGEYPDQHQQADEPSPYHKAFVVASVNVDLQAQHIGHVEGQDCHEPQVGHPPQSRHNGQPPDPGVPHQQPGLCKLLPHSVSRPSRHRRRGPLPDVTEGPEDSEGQEQGHCCVNGDDRLPRQHHQQHSGQGRAQGVTDVPSYSVEGQDRRPPVAEVG